MLFCFKVGGTWGIFIDCAGKNSEETELKMPERQKTTLQDEVPPEQEANPGNPDLPENPLFLVTPGS